MGDRGASPSGNGAKKGNRTMPPIYGGKHPIFDPKDPSTIAGYFDGLEMAAKEAGCLDDHKEVLRYALGYLDADTKRKWQQIEGGQEPYDYAAWKKGVLKTLPRTVRTDRGSLDRLDEVCRKFKQRPLGKEERAQFYDFTLAFQAEAKPLLAEAVPLISNRELVIKYLSCLKSVFREGLGDKLSNLNAANRTPEDPYTLQEVTDMATKMVEATAAGPFGEISAEAERAEYSRVAEVAVPSSRGAVDESKFEQLKIKQESMDSDFARVYATLDTVTSSMKEMSSRFESFATLVKNGQVQAQVPSYSAGPSSSAAAPPGQPFRPGMYTRPPGANFACFYCKDPSHGMTQCTQWSIDQQNKRVTQRGTSIFVDGVLIQRDLVDGLTMKDRVARMLRNAPPAGVHFMEQAEYYDDTQYDVFNQMVDIESPVTYAVLNQSLDRLRYDNQGALSAMTNQIVNALRPQLQQSSVPLSEPPKEVTARDILDSVTKLASRIDGLEQYAQNRPDGKKKSDF